MNKPKPPTKLQQQSNTHTYPNPKFTEAFVQTLKYEQEDEGWRPWQTGTK